MDALHSRRATPEAVVGAVTARFGPDAVVTDMHDREANYKAVAQGLVVMHPRSFDKDVWGRIREVREEFDPTFLRPAGQVTPGDKVLEGMIAEEKPLELTDEVATIASYAAMVGMKLLGFRPAVKVIRTDDLTYLACYGSRRITFNMSALGRG